MKELLNFINNNAVWIQTINVFVFILAMTAAFGLLKSISHSWYKLLPKGKQWMFQWFFCFPVGGLMFFHGEWLLYASGACLILVGVCPRMQRRHTLEAWLHVAGATGCILLALISVAVDFGQWIIASITLIVGLLLALVPALKVKNKDLWLEIIGITGIMIGLGIGKKKTYK